VIKKPKLNTATEVLQSLLIQSSMPISNEYNRWRVIQNWSEIIGPQLASRTFPIKYFKGHLYIWASSSSGMQQFYFISDIVRKKINAYMGKNWVHKITWTQNKGLLEKISPEDRKVLDGLIKKYD
jgi:predicted nucleic acid-binding Zn ribbon protein